MNQWVLASTEPSTVPLYLANGFLGTSLSWDAGILHLSKPSVCYVRGVYENGADGIDHLAEIPCWNLLRYGAAAFVREYRRELDLRHGILQTDMVLEEERGSLAVSCLIFLSRSDPYVGAARVRVVPTFDGQISFASGLSPAPGSGLEVVGREICERSLALTTRTTAYGVEVAQRLHFEEQVWQTSPLDGAASGLELRTDAVTGHETTLTLLAHTATTLDMDDPTAVVRREGESFDILRARHEQAWNELWLTDIEIEGDPEAQQFARAALFYLWSTMREGDDRSIAPMGLSSNFYNGHIFWDAELWMYPSLLLTQPKMASSCVAYRKRTLGAAHKRAAAAGYKGAQFPWEGAFTGEEMTPTWCDTRDFQLHITADVALAQWWHYLVTEDLEWLRTDGFPVIRACAEYWESRVEYRADKDRYEISDVVCADEYAVHVNNDAFTNAAVSKALLIALRAAELLGEPQPPRWREVAEKIYVPYDPASGRHLEFDGYDGQVTKQADVELLAYPLERVSDTEQIARDLDFYGGVIDPEGPAMSFSVYSILLAQLGRVTAAYEYLRRSFQPNTHSPFLAFSETPSNAEYYFCTGAGGALQTFLFGFTGLRLREGYFSLKPLLPGHWKALHLKRIHLSGMPTDIEITEDRLVVRRHSQESTAVLTVDRQTGQIDVDAGSFGNLRLELVGRDDEPVWSVPASEVREARNLGENRQGRLRLLAEDVAPIFDVALTIPDI
jgi:trehalose/maltose hydrolase-like predicted phosphorylase